MFTEIQNKLCNESLNRRLNDHNQHVDISLNEVLIPAIDDVTGLLNPDCTSASFDSDNTVVALGEAVCFQYMNASNDILESADIVDGGKREARIAQVSWIVLCTLWWPKKFSCLKNHHRSIMKPLIE